MISDSGQQTPSPVAVPSTITEEPWHLEKKNIY